MQEAGHLQSFDGKEWNQSDQGPDLERNPFTAGEAEVVIKEAVLVVPQGTAISAHMIHGVGYVKKVLKKLAGDILVTGVVLSQFECDREQIQTIHRHPAG